MHRSRTLIRSKHGKGKSVCWIVQYSLDSFLMISFQCILWPRDEALKKMFFESSLFSTMYPPASTFIAFILVPTTLIVFALLCLEFHRCIQCILITSVTYSPPQTPLGNPPPSHLSPNFRSSIFFICVCVSIAGVKPRVLYTPALLKSLLQFSQTSLEPAL